MTAAIDQTQPPELARLKHHVDELTHRSRPPSWYRPRRTEAARCAPRVRARRSVAQEGRATGGGDDDTLAPDTSRQTTPATIAGRPPLPVRVLNADAEPNWK